jgi:hypothetical protein
MESLYDSSSDSGAENEDVDAANLYANWKGMRSETKKKTKQVQTKSHKYVLTYNAFLFHTLFNLEKENNELQDMMIEELVMQFNRKASTLEFIENIEILNEKDEVELYWELDPGELGGSLLEIIQLD